MSDPIVTGVKADVTAIETKAESILERWEPYAIAAVCLIVGFLIGHFIR